MTAPRTRLTAFPLMVALLAAIVSAPAHAEKRVALVIGVDRYPNLAQQFQLQKAGNDADALGAALRQLGFDVTVGHNPGLDDMIGSVTALASRVEPGDTVFFFFSGHGLSPDNTNLLLPSDMPKIAGGPAGKEMARKRAYAEVEIIDSFRTALTDKKTGQQRGIIIFMSDACRNNPFAERGADPTRSVSGRSLGVDAKPTSGVFSIYSAGIGQEALDRLSNDDPSPNSVFMRAFVGELNKPGEHLGDLVADVRERVVELAATVIDSDTGRPHVQTPAYYDETRGGRIFLAGRAIGVESAQPPGTQSSAEPAAQGWAATKDTTSVAVLEDFIRQFGSTVYGSMARARLEELKKSQGAVVAPPAPPAVPSDPCGTTNNPVIARANGVAIRESDITLAEERIRSNIPDGSPEQKREHVIDYLVDVVLLSQAAANVDDCDGLKRELAFVQNRVLMEARLKSAGQAALSDQAEHQVYDEAVKRMKSEEEVHARHILVTTQGEAKAIAAQIKGGADFARLAKEKSKDPGGAGSGGDLGYFTKEQMVPEFAEVAFKLAKGQVSDPVKTQFGWHVIKVEDKRVKPKPTFEQVKEEIETYVTRRAQGELVQKVRSAANIERLDKSMAPSTSLNPATPAKK